MKNIIVAILVCILLYVAVDYGETLLPHLIPAKHTVGDFVTLHLGAQEQGTQGQIVNITSWGCDGVTYHVRVLTNQGPKVFALKDFELK